MTTLREKATELLLIARSIEKEDYFNDVTAEQQAWLEQVVRTIDTTAHLILAHTFAPPRRRIIDLGTRPKLRLVK